MKLSCNVIQDLLPLYHDGVCSEESKTLVDEHLEGCADCRDVLRTLKMEVTAAPAEEGKPLAAIGRAWKRGLWKALVKGFAIAMLVCGIFFGSFCLLTQWKFIPVSTHAMEVAEIYRLEDGRILYRLDVPEDVFCRDFKFETHEDGSSYKIPMCSLIETTKLQGFESYLDGYMMIDPAENNAYAKKTGGTIITSWYFGAPGDALLIYEEGMELEPAPADLEARYGAHG